MNGWRALPALAAAATAAAGCNPITWVKPPADRREDSLRSVARAIGADYDVVREDVTGAIALALRAACPGPEPRALVLVVDATSSMRARVEEVKRAAPLLLEAAGHGCRIAVIAYRDEGAGFAVRRIADFADPVEHAVAALGALVAAGGGGPEDVWLALDAATAAAGEPGLPARVLLVGNRGAHPSADTAARVRSRLDGGRITCAILSLQYSRAAPDPPRALSPPALATLLGGRLVTTLPGDAGSAVARELDGGAASAFEVALVVETAPMDGATGALADAAGAARRLEAAGGAVAIVGYGAFGDAHPAAVLAALHDRGAAAAMLDTPRSIPRAGDPAGTTGPLDGLHAAALLPWTPGHPHAILLLTDAGSDRDETLEKSVRAFLAETRTVLIVLNAGVRRVPAGEGSPRAPILGAPAAESAP